MSIIELDRVTFFHNKNVLILDDVTLGFEPGKFYAITGPSGCGKTTMLSLLGGLDSPISGRVLFGGKDIEQIGLQMHRRNDVAFVFQNYNLIDYLTPLENVSLTAKPNGEDFLTRMGLSEDEKHRSVTQLSGGQQQRVAIARALASGAPVILADEPTGSLDEDTAEEIIVLFKEAAEVYGKCVICVTHARQVAEQAHIEYALSHGKVSLV